MTVPAPVQPFVDAAHRYVERAIGLTLDGSDTSLAFVDHYIEAKARAEAVKPEVLALLAPALGAYFGEVVLARFGGAWQLDGADPAGWRVQLEAAPLSLSPVGMAAAALRGDDVDGYDATLTPRSDLLGPLEAALAASPPVDEAYFYSLTGRYETIQQAVDILAELVRRGRPDEDDDAGEPS